MYNLELEVMVLMPPKFLSCFDVRHDLLVCREIEETVAVLGHPGVTGASFFVAHFNYLCKLVPSCSRTDEDNYSTASFSSLS